MSIIGSPEEGCAAREMAPWPRVVTPNSARLERVRKSRRFTRLFYGRSRFAMRTRIYASVLLIAVAVLTGYRSQGQQSSVSQRTWPPPLQVVSKESPPLPPADALKTFFLPPG